MSFAVRNSPAGPIAARRPSPMRSEPGAVRASQVGRRAAPHWTKCRAGDKNGTSDQVVSPFGDGPRESEEKFLDVASVLEEARQLGDDFVFRDNDEGDVWELEGKLTADPVDCEYNPIHSVARV
ncbi:unnamed protein product [Ostreobium quekettii]|uniref:Uncharacterized protein n=1 Tax=Ostreobium quekettii TaxID=121088 RepID=A0A8S1IZ57_9CHLO|nr:unnamed protein product [Ostreobium quekettii]